MTIEKELKQAGIEVTEKLDIFTINRIAKNVAHKISNKTLKLGLDEKSIFIKLSKLDMYKANMPDGIAEANYFYKNCSIYFNSHIPNEELDEFAIHECLHYLQEKKDKNNNLLKMGLCSYNSSKPTGLGLNEAAVQYLSSKIIGIKPDYEKYYGINLFTPSPSYYPLECSLLNEILYFLDEDILLKSTIFSDNDFKNLIIEHTSLKVFKKIEKYFDLILNFEENIVITNNKLILLKENSSSEKYIKKINKYKEEIKESFLSAQNLIIESFFNYKFNKIIDLESLENFRKSLYKFSDIIGTTENYTFFDRYYAETMNKLEHKCNILENGGVETALESQKNNFIFKFILKLKSLFANEKKLD